jgi:Rab family, other
MDAGDSQSVDHIPIACKDAVAILYMFDLTSRCTLNKLVFGPF